MKAFGITLAILVLSGCASSGRIGELPVVPDKTKAGKTVVVRVSSFQGAAHGYTIALDGKDLFGIGSGEYAEFLVAEGKHSITIKCFGGLTPTLKEQSLEFVTKASEKSFFVVGPNMSTCAEITQANESDAKKHLEGSKFIDLEKPVAS